MKPLHYYGNPHSAALICGHVMDRRSVVMNFSRGVKGGIRYSGDCVKKRTLSGTARAKYALQLSALQVKGNIAQKLVLASSNSQIPHSEDMRGVTHPILRRD
jgi:hypothetical protein